MVVATAISKSKHDEALRELLIQLAIADLITLIAASLVGYATARAALNPVERYRVAAENAEGAPVLPVDLGKDDEVTWEPWPFVADHEPSAFAELFGGHGDGACSVAQRVGNEVDHGEVEPVRVAVDAEPARDLHIDRPIYDAPPPPHNGR